MTCLSRIDHAASEACLWNAGQYLAAVAHRPGVGVGFGGHAGHVEAGEFDDADQVGGVTFAGVVSALCCLGGAGQLPAAAHDAQLMQQWHCAAVEFGGLLLSLGEQPVGRRRQTVDQFVQAFGQIVEARVLADRASAGADVVEQFAQRGAVVMEYLATQQVVGLDAGGAS